MTPGAERASGRGPAAAGPPSPKKRRKNSSMPTSLRWRRSARGAVDVDDRRGRGRLHHRREGQLHLRPWLSGTARCLREGARWQLARAGHDGQAEDGRAHLQSAAELAAARWRCSTVPGGAAGHRNQGRLCPVPRRAAPIGTCASKKGGPSRPLGRDARPGRPPQRRGLDDLFLLGRAGILARARRRRGRRTRSPPSGRCRRSGSRP